MNNFKKYKTLGKNEIFLKIIYEDYPKIDGGNYPPRLKVIVSGLNKNIIENENQKELEGHKFISLFRDDWAIIRNINSNVADNELKLAEQKFQKCSNIQEVEDDAIVYLLNKVKKYLNDMNYV